MTGMPSDDVKARTEYRVVDGRGDGYSFPSRKAAIDRAARWQEGYPDQGPHRVQRRTITTTPWEDVTGDE